MEKGPNYYAYGRNNPIYSIDFLGLEPVWYGEDIVDTLSTVSQLGQSLVSLYNDWGFQINLPALMTYQIIMMTSLEKFKVGYQKKMAFLFFHNLESLASEIHNYDSKADFTGLKY